MNIIGSTKDLIKELKEEVHFSDESRDVYELAELSAHLLGLKILKETPDLKVADEDHKSYGRKKQRYLERIIAGKVDQDVVIAPGPEGIEGFHTSNRSTSIPQREKLELTIKNLCACLNISEVHLKEGQQGEFYRPSCGAISDYQSASNVILELSQMLALQLISQRYK